MGTPSARTRSITWTIRGWSSDARSTRSTATRAAVIRRPASRSSSSGGDKGTGVHRTGSRTGTLPDRVSGTEGADPPAPVLLHEVERVLARGLALRGGADVRGRPLPRHLHLPHLDLGVVRVREVLRQRALAGQAEAVEPAHEVLGEDVLADPPVVALVGRLAEVADGGADRVGVALPAAGRGRQGDGEHGGEVAS